MTAVTRVLVVDDNEDSRDIYSEILSFAGHGVVTAADGEEALAYALHVPFDLIILDLCLPKVGGIRVIKEVRDSPNARSTPIITISAGDELMHRDALAAGADVALKKPCLPQDLRVAVDILLEAARNREGKRARARSRRS